MRTGLRTARRLANRDGARLVTARGPGPYASLEDAWRRTGVPLAALRRLAAADAFTPGLGLSRREALWAIRGLRDAALPLLAAADAREGATRPELVEEVVALRPMSAGREVAEDYRATSLSLHAHPLTFLRADLAAKRYVPCSTLARTRDSARVAVAGLVLIRQKPGSAKGVMFITLEDEGGIANLIVWPSLFERQRALVLRAGLLGCRGRVQR